MGRVEQEYLVQELNEVLVGTSPCEGVPSEGVAPTNSRVSFAPLLPHTLAQSTPLLSKESAMAFCEENSLPTSTDAGFCQQVSKVVRALKENAELINPSLPLE